MAINIFSWVSLYVKFQSPESFLFALVAQEDI